MTNKQTEHYLLMKSSWQISESDWNDIHYLINQSTIWKPFIPVRMDNMFVYYFDSIVAYSSFLSLQKWYVELTNCGHVWSLCCTKKQLVANEIEFSDLWNIRYASMLHSSFNVIYVFWHNIFEIEFGFGSLLWTNTFRMCKLKLIYCFRRQQVETDREGGKSINWDF